MQHVPRKCETQPTVSTPMRIHNSIILVLYGNHHLKLPSHAAWSFFKLLSEYKRFEFLVGTFKKHMNSEINQYKNSVTLLMPIYKMYLLKHDMRAVSKLHLQKVRLNRWTRLMGAILLYISKIFWFRSCSYDCKILFYAFTYK